MVQWLICLSTVVLVASASASSVTDAWTVSSAPKASWTCVSSNAKGNFAVATATGVNGGIYVSNDYGVTWALTSAPANLTWSAVSSDSLGQNLYATADNTGVYASFNFGATWTLEFSSDNITWGAISSSSDGKYVFAGSKLSHLISGGIFRSSDYGESWNHSLYAAVRSIACDSTCQYVYVATSDKAGVGVLVSNDFGLSFKNTDDQLPPGGHDYHCITTSSNGQYVNTASSTAQGPYVYASVDFGANWVQVSKYYESLYITTMKSSANGKFLIGGESTAVSYSKLYTSSDYGVSWKTVGPLSYWISVSSDESGQYLLAANSQNILYYISSSDAHLNVV